MKADNSFDISWNICLRLAMIIAVSFLSLGDIYGDAADPQASGASVKLLEEVRILKGDLEEIPTPGLTRVAVRDPGVADILEADGNRILLIGHQPGETPIFIWDNAGKRTLIVRVFLDDLNLVRSRLETLLEQADIQGILLELNDKEGKVIVSGYVTKDQQDDFNKIVGPFQNSIMNLVKTEDSQDLIQIDVQIAELNTSLTKGLGIEWTKTADYAEATPGFDGSLGDLFKIGDFTRTSAIAARVDALILEGKGRVLSKPKLVVVSGKSASFQVGGEVPVSATTTSSGGTVTQNITFKSYGIGLTVTPTIQGNKIDIVLSVNVSDVDQSTAVGQNVGFATRTAQTQLYLDNKQTIVIAGLIKHNEGSTVQKVPFLGDIPIVGLIFRHTSIPEKDTELVISLTPMIVSREKEESLAGSTDKEEEKQSEGAVEKSKYKEEAKNSLPAAGESSPQKEQKLEPAGDKEPQDSDSGGKAKISKAVALEAPFSVSENGVPEKLKEYIQAIQKTISKAISYPYEAKEKGWQGTVKLTLRLLRDGTLLDVSVKESSGHDVFDKDALNTTQILAPYPSFPSTLDLEELIVTIPIDYGPEVLLQDVVCGTTDKILAAAPRVFVPGVPYTQLVQQRIVGVIGYPEEVKAQGWQGTVKLALNIAKDGTLSHVSVKESSGHAVFDDCALSAAKKVAPYAVFPSESDLEEINVTVPIVYSLEGR